MTILSLMMCNNLRHVEKHTKPAPTELLPGGAVSTRPYSCVHQIPDFQITGKSRGSVWRLWEGWVNE